MTEKNDRIRRNKLTRIFESSAPRICLLEPGGSCNEKATLAHSIQKAVLKRIADNNNHVITVMPKTLKAAANPKREKFDKIHIDLASTGTFACNPHDTLIFQSLENWEPDWNNPADTFNLAFKAVVYNYWLEWLNRAAWQSRSELWPSEPGAKLEAEFVDARKSRFRNTMDFVNSVRDSEDYGALCYVTRKLEGVPIVASSTVSYVLMNPTEPQDLEDQSSFLSVTVYPSEGGHIVSMAFPKKGQSSMPEFCNVNGFPNDTDFEEAVSEFLLINPYNTFLSPGYWLRFSQRQRDTIHQQVLAHEKTREILKIHVPPPAAIGLFNLFRVIPV